MNTKAKGEIGQAIVIGELAKHNIPVALPMSDNLPFDLILIVGSRLVKAQVKSSNYCQRAAKNSVTFNLRSNNWHSRTTKKYTTDEVDVVLLCDYETVFVLGPKEFANRNSFAIRYQPSKNGQVANVNLAEHFKLSQERLQEVLPSVK